MEIFCPLLALCEGNSPFTGDFPSQWPVTRSFDVLIDLRLNKRLSKQSWRGELRRHGAHHGVIVMILNRTPNAAVPSVITIQSWPIHLYVLGPAEKYDTPPTITSCSETMGSAWTKSSFYLHFMPNIVVTNIWWHLFRGSFGSHESLRLIHDIFLYTPHEKPW